MELQRKSTSMQEELRALLAERDSLLDELRMREEKNLRTTLEVDRLTQVNPFFIYLFVVFILNRN